MNALSRWLDVDLRQWRALVRASLRVDLAALQIAQARGGSWKVTPTVWLSLFIYTISGASPAMIAAVAADSLFSATVLVTIVGFMVMSTLLVGEGATIMSPSDHHVLGFRPVTSRTYLAVRIASLSVRTVIITSCVALAPVLVFLLKGGLHPGRAVAALAAAYGAAFAVTLTIVATYGWMLRLAGPTRMMRYASYTQFTAQMLTWGGLVIVTQELGKRAVSGLSLTGSLWALVYPGTWFASYVSIASGNVGTMTIVPAALSIALLVALARAIGGKLSLGYAESLGRLTTVAAPRSARQSAGTRWLRLLDSETRAVAILVRSHLQHDMRFRLGLISLIPITLMYMYMGGSPADPFVAGAHAKRPSNAPVIQMALLFLPITLRRVLVTSEKYRASWIFHSTPADHAKLVLSSRNIITLFFLAPYLLFLGAMFAYSFHEWSHALLHAAFTGMLSYLVLQFTVMVNPQLPFSQPPEKDTQSGRMFGIMLGATLVGLGLYFLLTTVVYKSAIGMLLATLVFLALAFAMDRVTRRRALSAAHMAAE